MEKKVCECCGAYLVDQKTKWVCEHCLTEYKKSFVESDEVQRLLNIANKTRLSNKFIDAKKEYTSIIEKFPDCTDAYWGRLLSELGIEYVKSPEDIYYPSCHRLTFSNIFSEEDYKKVISLSDEESKPWYEDKAKQIEDIRIELINLTKNFDPFDIFISYKENDDKGNVTKDSQYVTDLYHLLTDLGYKVFLSRITLGQIAGSKYEPYIYSAISTAQCMIVYATQKEYIEATWLKNEWSRYLELIHTGQKKKGSLIPIYNGMDPYDFPMEFDGIQGLNQDDINFKDKLEKIITRIIGKKGNKYVETKYFKKKELQSNSDFKVNTSFIPSLTKRRLGDNKEVKEITINEEKTLDNGFQFLDKQLFDAAIVQFNTILRKNNTNYKAYFGRFLANLNINESYLKNINHRNFTPYFKSNIDFKDVEFALDYAPTKSMAQKILDDCVLIFRYMQYWKVDTRYKYNIITEFFKLLISFLEDEPAKELKEVLWDDFQYLNENDEFYIDNLLLLHQASILLVNEEKVEDYIEETSKLVKMLIKKQNFRKAKEINNQLLKIDISNADLLFNQALITMKSKSDSLLIEAVIYERKYKALETLITRARNPETSVKRILDATKQINIALYQRQYKKVMKVVDMALSYLPNFNEEDFIKELIFFGNMHLEMMKFKEAEKYFDEVLELNNFNVEGLWGKVKVKAKCPTDMHIIKQEIDVIKYQEFNLLINTTEDTSYYTDIYHHIKKKVLSQEQIIEIKNNNLGFYERYHKSYR